MKNGASFLLLLFCTVTATAQNEFANPAFYAGIKLLKEDGANGFVQSKGKQLRTLGQFFSIHESTQSLPGTDSSRVTIPIGIGSPGAQFYFKPLLTMEAAQKKEADLLAAIKTAWGISFTEKKLTDTAAGFIFHRTRLYNNPQTSGLANPAIETYVARDKNKYILGLLLHGVNPAPRPHGKSNLPPETDINSRIKELLQSMDNHFAGEKAVLKSTNTYYTEYESQYKLYGQAGKVKFRAFESSLYWQLGYEQLGSPAKAKELFEKLKTAFSGTGRFTFKTETTEGSRTWIYASEAGQNAITTKFTLVLEYYEAANNFSVGLLLTKKKK